MPPSASTFRRVLWLLHATAAAAFGAWLICQVLAGLADADAIMIALDGKTVPGARTKDGKVPRLLAAMICRARAVIAQRDHPGQTAAERGRHHRCCRNRSGYRGRRTGETGGTIDRHG